MITRTVTLPRVIRSEWTKICSLRSTWLLLGATAILGVGIAGTINWAANRETGGVEQTLAEAVGRAYLAMDLFSLVIAVFGVLLITSEYGSGLIRSTLMAVPRRVPVLVAKATVLVAATAPVMLLTCILSFLVGQRFVAPEARFSLADAEVFRATLGAAFAPVGLGLLALGVGALIRHTAGAISVYVAALLIVPAILPAVLPASIQDEVQRFSPVAAAQALYAVDTATNPFPMLSPGPAALVLLGWAALPLAGAAIMLRRRDA